MRLLLPTLLLAPALAFSQIRKPFAFPVLPKSGTSTAAFIPENWAVLDSASGDLNKDGRPDLALALEGRDTVQIYTIEKRDEVQKLANPDDTSGFYIDTLETKPRILIVLFRTVGGYRLAERSTFVPLAQDNMEEPLHDIKIRNGVLHIETGVFMSMGGWGASTTKYHWRYRNGAFRLIGADISSMSRSTQETDEYSINFATGKYRHAHTPGYESEEDTRDKPTAVKWRPTPKGPLKTFKTFPRPYTWYRKEWDSAL